MTETCHEPFLYMPNVTKKSRRISRFFEFVKSDSRKYSN